MLSFARRCRGSAVSVLVVVTVLFAPLATSVAQEPADDAASAGLSENLENVRAALGIPGMAAAVVDGGELVWAEGFGYADVENEREATPNTPFGLASVTKPIAATLIMQLVEEGAVDLDAPVAQYGVDLGDGVTVRHLLTHTSEGTPGAAHNYNGNRYGMLGGVIEAATGRTFAALLSERVLVPLGLWDTALNPVSSWQGVSLRGFEGFRRAVGWGASFEHYPDVYTRLARPYQFDADYELIPGMYHLYHNPAAGLVSSVTDLAVFDIALDEGAIIGEPARTEMFTPAIPTVIGRSDLAYGLGWYVQDFDGLRLIWHAGRWPPSTSALYVKVPDESLTFLVLANTDNLTVPFSGIGDGDVVGSMLALTFFRHYVFPRQHGYELPAIDWNADQPELAGRLTAVDDNDTRLFLERELWAMRQALASSGQSEQAEVLMRTGLEAFPSSPLRSDPSLMYTAGQMPEIDPIPSARAFAWMSRAVMGWLIVLVVSFLWMLVRLMRLRQRSVWDWAVWLIAALFLGPIAIGVHRLAARPADSGRESAAAVCASLVCVTGYGLAWILAIMVLFSVGDDPNPLVILAATLLTPFAVGLLLVRGPMLRRSGLRPFRTAVRRGLVGEFVTLLVAVGVFFVLTFYVESRWFSTLPYPTSPYFWAMMSVMTAAGMAALIPLHRGLQRRGYTVWPEVAGSAALRLPTIRDAWWVLLMAVGFMVGMIALAVSRFS